MCSPRCLSVHRQVSDVNDDVRRAAVIAIGFLLFHNPEQCPSVVSLLSESYNPHVRYGAAMALGVACAGQSGHSRVRKVALFPIFLNLEFLFCEIFDCKE